MSADLPTHLPIQLNEKHILYYNSKQARSSNLATLANARWAGPPSGQQGHQECGVGEFNLLARPLDVGTTAHLIGQAPLARTSAHSGAVDLVLAASSLPAGRRGCSRRSFWDMLGKNGGSPFEKIVRADPDSQL